MNSRNPKPLWINAFHKPLWRSSLQLGLVGGLLFALSFNMAPSACSAAGLGEATTAFRCQFGALPDTTKLWVLLGLCGASLCWGRAVSLLEKDQRQRV